jgi:protein ImuB
MRRIVSLWLPDWPIERFNRAAGYRTTSPSSHKPAEPKPFALVGADHGALFLSAVNAAARNRGLRVGQPLADAKAILPALITRPAEPDADAKALSKLADWCVRYTPWVNTDGADGLWLDITGCAHLFGDEAGLIRDLTERLKRLSFTARAGIADTPGAAWAVARFSDEAIVPPGEARQALSALSVEGLRLPGDVVLLLRRLGLQRIGELYGLPRAALARRFGAGKKAHLTDAVLDRLDQALGRKSEPVSPLGLVPAYRTHLRLAEPLITLDGIEAVLRRLLETLCATLAHDHQGGRSLRLSAFRVDGTADHVDIATGRGVRDPTRLMRLFVERLESIDPGFGIDMMVLNAYRVDAMPPEQVAFDAGPALAERDEVGDLVDRLSNRLGPVRVYRLAAEERHIPERAERCIPAQKAEANSGPWESDGSRRPARLLERPEAVQVMAEVPEGPPIHFVWRHASHRVVRASGPERIAPEWWLEEGADFSRIRDYYRVESETGQSFWIYREGLYQLGHEHMPRWFLHGLFA